MAAEAAMFAASQEQQTEPDRGAGPVQLVLGTLKAQRAVAELQLMWHQTEFSAASGHIAELLSKIENELAGVRAYLTRRHSSREASVDECWKAIFVHHLALAWENLTSSEPRGGREFVGFISAAWHSLGRAIPATSWDHAIHVVNAAKKQAKHRVD